MTILFVEDPESLALMDAFVREIRALSRLSITIEFLTLEEVNEVMARKISLLPSNSIPKTRVPDTVVVESVEACLQSSYCGLCGRKAASQPDTGRYVIMPYTVQMVAAHVVSQLTAVAA